MILLPKTFKGRVRRFQAGGRLVPPVPAMGSVPNRVSYNVIDAAQYTADLSGLFNARPQTRGTRATGGGGGGSDSKAPKLDLSALKDLGGMVPEQELIRERYMQLYQQLVDGYKVGGEEFGTSAFALQLSADMAALTASIPQAKARATFFDKRAGELSEEKINQIYTTPNNRYIARDVDGNIAEITDKQLFETIEKEVYNEETQDVELKSFRKYQPMTNGDVMNSLTTEKYWYYQPSVAQTAMNGLNTDYSKDEATDKIKKWFDTKGYKKVSDKVVLDEAGGPGQSYTIKEIANQIGTKTNYWFNDIPVLDKDGKPVLDENGKATYSRNNFGLAAALNKHMSTLNMSDPAFRGIYLSLLPGAKSPEDARIQTYKYIEDTFREHYSIDELINDSENLSGKGNGGGEGSEGGLSGTTSLANSIIPNFGLAGTKPVIYENGVFKEGKVNAAGTKETNDIVSTVTVDLAVDDFLRVSMKDKALEVDTNDKADKETPFNLNDPMFSNRMNANEAFTPEGDKIRPGYFAIDESQDPKVGLFPVVWDGGKGSFRLLKPGDEAFDVYQEYSQKKQEILDKFEKHKKDPKVKSAGDDNNGPSAEYLAQLTNELTTLANTPKYANMQIQMMKLYTIKGVYQHTITYNPETNNWDDASEEKLLSQYSTTEDGDDIKKHGKVHDTEKWGNRLTDDDQDGWFLGSIWDDEMYNMTILVPSLAPIVLQAMDGAIPVAKETVTPSNFGGYDRWNAPTISITDVDRVSNKLSDEEKLLQSIKDDPNNEIYRISNPEEAAKLQSRLNDYFNGLNAERLRVE